MDAKSTQSKSVNGKTIPLDDFMAVKKKAEKLEAEIAKLNHRLEVVDLKDVEDGDLKNMKVYFLSREAELDKREKEIEDKEDDYGTRESAIKEREKTDLIQSLIVKYAPKGEDKKAKDAFLESLKASDDPEKEALKLYAERTNVEEEKPSAENVFESTKAGGKIVKSPLNMNKEELAAFREANLAKV